MKRILLEVKEKNLSPKKGIWETLFDRYNLFHEASLLWNLSSDPKGPKNVFPKGRLK